MITKLLSSSGRQLHCCSFWESSRSIIADGCILILEYTMLTLKEFHSILINLLLDVTVVYEMKRKILLVISTVGSYCVVF
jgi:hypothetical protein